MSSPLESAVRKLGTQPTPFPLEYLPPFNSDVELWNRIESTYGLSLPELAALKTYSRQQQQQQQQDRMLTPTTSIDQLINALSELPLPSALSVKAHHEFPECEYPKSFAVKEALKSLRTSADFCNALLFESDTSVHVEKVYYKVTWETGRRNVLRSDDSTFTSFVECLENVDTEFGLVLYHRSDRSAPPSPTVQSSERGFVDQVDWKIPVGKSLRRFTANDKIAMYQLGANFPLLDRESELELLMNEMGKAVAKGKEGDDEPNRWRNLYCFGGVSGSGKTRLAKEVAPRFNQLDKDCKALFSRIDGLELKTDMSLLPKLLLLSLLEQSEHNDPKGATENYLRAESNSDKLECILSLIGRTIQKALVVVNLDEAQHLSADELINVACSLRMASRGRAAKFWLLPTGLDLQLFDDFKTRSGSTTITVKALSPVRNIGRALFAVLDIEKTKIRAMPELEALLASLHGVPRLLWAALAVFSGGQSYSVENLGDYIVSVEKVISFLSTAEPSAIGAVYQGMLSFVRSSAPELFVSLANLSQWSGLPGLLACLLSAAPVSLKDQIGDKTVAQIAHAGWATLVEGDSGTFHLELPLLYLHSDFISSMKTSFLREGITVMRSPQKKLTSDDAEILDKSVLLARVHAYIALGKKSLTLSEILGGLPIPTHLQKVQLMIGLDTSSIDVVVQDNLTPKEVLSSVADHTVRVFLSKERSSFADSGISFKKISNAGKIGGTCSRPASPDSFAVLIQSKRFLSSKTSLDAKLVEAEFAKVKNCFKTCPFLLVFVTDKDANLELVPEKVRDWVVIVDRRSMQSFLGPMLAGRRLASAKVTQQGLKHPAKID